MHGQYQDFKSPQSSVKFKKIIGTVNPGPALDNANDYSINKRITVQRNRGMVCSLYPFLSRTIFMLKLIF